MLSVGDFVRTPDSWGRIALIQEFGVRPLYWVVTVTQYGFVDSYFADALTPFEPNQEERLQWMTTLLLADDS